MLHGSIEESFTLKRSDLHNSFNTQRKIMIRFAVYSMSQDLSKPHVDFKNRSFRNFTLWLCSCGNRVSLVPISENRIVYDVVGGGCKVQLSSTVLGSMEFCNCHGSSSFATVRIWSILPPILFNRSPKLPADDDQSKKKQRKSRILDEWWKKCGEKLWEIERICEILDFDLKKWLLILSILLGLSFYTSC